MIKARLYNKDREPIMKGYVTLSDDCMEFCLPRIVENDRRSVWENESEEHRMSRIETRRFVRRRECTLNYYDEDLKCIVWIWAYDEE